jgi:hypothetical protein
MVKKTQENNANNTNHFLALFLIYIVDRKTNNKSEIIKYCSTNLFQY